MCLPLLSLGGPFWLGVSLTTLNWLSPPTTAPTSYRTPPRPSGPSAAPPPSTPASAELRPLPCGSSGPRTVHATGPAAHAAAPARGTPSPTPPTPHALPRSSSPHWSTTANGSP